MMHGQRNITLLNFIFAKIGSSI